MTQRKKMSPHQNTEKKNFYGYWISGRVKWGQTVRTRNCRLLPVMASLVADYGASSDSDADSDTVALVGNLNILEKSQCSCLHQLT